MTSELALDNFRTNPRKKADPGFAHRLRTMRLRALREGPAVGPYGPLQQWPDAIVGHVGSAETGHANGQDTGPAYLILPIVLMIIAIAT
jgi:hypothetical protein